MSKTLAFINILWALFDTAICGLAVCLFGWGSYHFERWWILLFSIIPLLLYNSHTLIIDSDIQAAKGGEED